MEKMLSEICGELCNYFEDRSNIQRGEFTARGGFLFLPNVKEGQFIRIVGSTFNDGVHMYPCYTLQDETFSGTIYALQIPPELVEIATQLATSRNTAAASGEATNPYIMESFNGYQYTRATDAHGAPADWRVLYASKFDKWRKLPK